MGEGEILVGDVRERLQGLPDDSVQCCVTSPPYWGLRDYGVGRQLGLEPVMDCAGWATGVPCGQCYICHMTEVFREVRRVLRPDGVAFVNMGDSFSSGGRSVHGTRVGHKQATNRGMCGENDPPRADTPAGLKPKDLCMVPARLALALQADGWYLRSDIIWMKPNPMPESTRDRPTKAHEYIFLLAKSERYFWDQEAVREPPSEASVVRLSQATLQSQNGGFKQDLYEQDFPGRKHRDRRPAEIIKAMDVRAGRNIRDVWSIPTQPYPEAHFATFPEAIPERCIAAGTSERGCCPECGKPWERIVEKSGGTIGKSWHDHDDDLGRGMRSGVASAAYRDYRVDDRGWRAGCKCGVEETVPCVVLDPFLGSGTTAAVAKRMGRRYIGIELNTEYIALAEKRIALAGYSNGDRKEAETLLAHPTLFDA